MVPQLLAKSNDVAFAPVTVKPEITSGVVPVLVRVTSCDRPMAPVSRVPSARLVVDNVMVVESSATPVPLSAMDCCDAVALSVMVTAAVSEPPSVGVKWPWMVQVPATGTVAAQLFANTNEEASVPVTAMLEMDKGMVPVLVRVTDCEALVAPTWVIPKARLVAVSDMEVPPVPLRVMVCGEPLALSVMVIDAVNGPAADGVK